MECTERRVKKALLVNKVIALSCTFALSMLFSAEEGHTFITHRTIVLKADDGATPNFLVSVPDTTVILINYSRGPVVVYFTGGDLLKACAAPVHFTPAKDGGYTSKPITFGSVASLCFVRAGTYKYLVRWLNQLQGKAKEFRGTITIK